MKVILQTNGIDIIRFDKNEELIETLTSYARINDIQAAYFTAIGAAKEISLAYYNPETKAYEDRVIRENLEIVGISGNIALLNNQPVIHAHGVFAKKDLSTFGGHLKKLVVSATCEIVLTIFDGKLERVYNEDTGLNLFN